MWGADDEPEFADNDPEVHDAADAGPGTILDPEVWMDYYGDDLLDLWYSLKEGATMRGCILDVCDFNDFAHFCFQFSSGYPPSS